MSNAPRTADVIVIGAGIAGASASYELAHHGANVILAEKEEVPGYHTTGRSAATFVGCYGNDVIRSISAASRPFFAAPPDGFSQFPILSERGALYIAGCDQLAAFEAFMTEPSNEGLLESITPEEAIAKAPVLRPETVANAAFEPAAQDIDVNALLRGYLHEFHNAGGELVPRAEITRMLRRAGNWELETLAGKLLAPVVINATGAWGDEIAELAGIKPVGLVPKRRTALTIDLGYTVSNWPLTISLDEMWYFRPEAGHLLISPADETPSLPCDSQPEEIDVAECIDRIQSVTTLEISRLMSKRAGLRTFVHDKTPVCGFATDTDGFFWLVGQGGYGIQTAPVLAQLTALLVAGNVIPTDLVERNVTAATLGPDRLSF